jgi:hypothetical protein
MRVPALAGCAAVAGYAVTRPLSAAAQVGALLDVAALLATAVLAASLFPERLPARLRHVAAPLVVGLLLATRSVRDAVLAGAQSRARWRCCCTRCPRHGGGAVTA